MRFDFEYELMPENSMEWAVLDSEQNKAINDTLSISFENNPDMADRFIELITAGRTVKYMGHMIRLSPVNILDS